jgi:hypothetical protein
MDRRQSSKKTLLDVMCETDDPAAGQKSRTMQNEIE